MKKLIFVIFLAGCADGGSCLYDIASDLGTLTAQQVTQYEEQGCCQYNGGVSPTISCSGLLICKDNSTSTCSK